NGIREIQIDALPVRPDAAPFVAHFLGVSRRDIAGHEIAETRIAVFQIVVAFAFGNITRSALVVLFFRHPYAPVIAQRLGHQCQLRLMLASEWDARRMNLREARVAKKGSAPMRTPDRSTVGGLGVG